MDKAIPAAEANRKFSEILRGVRQGHSYLVTSHGKAVARIASVADGANAARSARDALLRRLRRQTTTHVGRWKREELYEERQ